MKRLEETEGSEEIRRYKKKKDGKKEKGEGRKVLFNKQKTANEI